jgi:hypothetical protein
LSSYRAFTREGRWVFMVALVTGAFAVDVTNTQVYLLFSVLLVGDARVAHRGPVAPPA